MSSSEQPRFLVRVVVGQAFASNGYVLVVQLDPAGYAAVAAGNDDGRARTGEKGRPQLRRVGRLP